MYQVRVMPDGKIRAERISFLREPPPPAPVHLVQRSGHPGDALQELHVAADFGAANRVSLLLYIVLN